MNNYKFVSFALLFVAVSLQGCDHYEGNLRNPATDYKVFWDLDDKYVTDEFKTVKGNAVLQKAVQDILNMRDKKVEKKKKSLMDKVEKELNDVPKEHSALVKKLMELGRIDRIKPSDFAKKFADLFIKSAELNESPDTLKKLSLGVATLEIQKMIDPNFTPVAGTTK